MNVSQICQLLNNYLFNNVWNGPNTNFKKNTQLQRLFKRYGSVGKHSSTGSFRTPSHTIQLPNPNEPYYIYYIDRSILDYSGIEVTNEWKSLDSFNGTQFTFTAVNVGRTLSRCKIFLYHYIPSNDILVAISKKMMLKLCGAGFDPDECNLIIYDNWDNGNTVSHTSIEVVTEADRVIAWNQTQTNPTSVFINGQLQTTFGYPDIHIGDYIDVVKDSRITSTYTIDMSIEEGKNLFISPEDNRLYAICHIPKAHNPLNKVLSHLTMDVYASPVQPTGIKGLLLCSKELTFKQITHNDIGIPDDLLMAYGNLLGTQEIELFIQIREYSHTTTLVRDKNYIDLLYKHTDTEIVNFLIGMQVLNLDFWTAEHLCQSNYVKYMTSLPSFVNKTNIDTYVETFGYQHTLALLIDSVRKFVYDVDIQYPFVVRNPALFVNNMLPLVTVGDSKINNNNLIVKHSIDYTTIGIDGVDEIAEGTPVIIEMIETSTLTNFTFTTTPTIDRITLPSNQYEIYRKQVTVEVVEGIDVVYNTSYVKLVSPSYTVTTVGNNFTYIFTTGLFWNEVIFVPVEGTFVVSKNINYSMNVLEPIYVDLTIPIPGTADTIPALNIRTTKVYLNGKTLVEGVDYLFKEYKINGNVCGTQIVVFNANYSAESNVLEVIFSRNESEKFYTFFSSSTDSVIDNSYVWFDSIGTVCVDGIQTLGVQNTNRGVIVTSPHRAGALVESSCVYPKQFKDFIDRFRSDEAEVRERLLTEYFDALTPPDPTEDIAIPYPHYLYSLKVCMVVRDMLNGSLQIAYEPAESRSINLDLSNYAHLDVIDIINTDIDKRFIDFKLAYCDVHVPSTQVLQIVDYLAKLIIDDPLTYDGIA